MSQLELKELSVVLSGQRVIQEITFSLERGRIGCLLGPSGCGKTTMLRAIAGFELPEKGQVFIDEAEVSREGWVLAPEQRRIGMVFQDFALFPHLCVRDNIAFGLKRMARSKIVERVHDLLQLVGLGNMGRAFPHQLSGGEQQRVALARALAPRPNILLLDEPFSSMDAELREQLAREVRDILRQEQTTAIFVTHNQFEAFAMADEIGVMNAGRLRQWDTGYELYHHPGDRFVAEFIGQGAFIPGIVLDTRHIKTAIGVISGTMKNAFKTDETVDVLIRPDDIMPDDRASLRATVTDKIFQGATFRYTLHLQHEIAVSCVIPSHYDYAIDDEIGICLNTKHLVAFKRED